MGKKKIFRRKYLGALVGGGRQNALDGLPVGILDLFVFSRSKRVRGSAKKSVPRMRGKDQTEFLGKGAPVWWGVESGTTHFLAWGLGGCHGL